MEKGGIDKSQVFDTMIDYYDQTMQMCTETAHRFYRLSLFSFPCRWASWAVLKVSCRKRVPVGKILLENVVLFGFIGVIEYVFFQEIATKYIPTKPSFLIDQTLQSLKDKFAGAVKSEGLY